jgi:hypothetical protein
MKKIIQRLILALLFTGPILSSAEEIELTAIVPKPVYDPLPKTGQTVSYRLYDDGYYRMGNPVTPRFILGTGAQAGTVTDNATGLMWEQKINEIGNIHHYNYTFDWYNAFDPFLYGPAGLNTVCFAGYDDWRIPNLNELQTLVNYGIYSYLRVHSIFISDPFFTKNQYYWTSTSSLVENASWAKAVGFFYGYTLDGGKTNSTSYYVRAVRGGRGGLN